MICGFWCAADCAVWTVPLPCSVEEVIELNMADSQSCDGSFNGSVLVSCPWPMSYFGLDVAVVLVMEIILLGVIEHLPCYGCSFFYSVFGLFYTEWAVC